MIPGPAPSEVETVLALLGAGRAAATDEERDALTRHGYVVLPHLIVAEDLENCRERMEQALARFDVEDPKERKESGTRHASFELPKPCHLRVVHHPKLLSLVFHLLGRRFFTKRRVHGRDPTPGYGLQGLHADWTSTQDPEISHVVTCIALLDAFTAVNGATRVVPGSHRSRGTLPKTVSDPAFVHSRQQIIEAPAGSVLMFCGHLLHAGTRNEGQGPRRVLQFGYFAHEHIRMKDASPELDPVVDPLQRYLLG